MTTYTDKFYDKNEVKEILENATQIEFEGNEYFIISREDDYYMGKFYCQEALKKSDLLNANYDGYEPRIKDTLDYRKGSSKFPLYEVFWLLLDNPTDDYLCDWDTIDDVIAL